MQEVELYYIKKRYPVFVTYLNASKNDLKDINNNIIKYREDNPKSNDSNVKAWHSNYNTHEQTDSFDSINQKIVHECNEIINDFNDTKVRYEITNMWLNMYEKGDHTVNHCHNALGSYYSCCYYTDVEENCSPIKFPPKLDIIPKNDMLIIFGGHVYHEVPPTSGKRTLISINFFNIDESLGIKRFDVPLKLKYS
tara:strand:- start:88 stop:672 length:585 start_codon:yes stop_codon:yes gene_type:complete